MHGPASDLISIEVVSFPNVGSRPAGSELGSCYLHIGYIALVSVTVLEEVRTNLIIFAHDTIQGHCMCRNYYALHFSYTVIGFMIPYEEVLEGARSSNGRTS